MPKRRRLLTTAQTFKHKLKDEQREGEMLSARGRLQGALLDVLEPAEDDSCSDDSGDSAGQENGRSRSLSRSRSRSPQRQPYVLKLFDRSVDLSQFSEDSPLYPVCRAWILNQPRAVYAQSSEQSEPGREWEGEGEALPAPVGPPVSRVPALLPEQVAASKHNISLNYKESPPVSRDRLLHAHLQRWSAVRDAWLAQARLAEARHAPAQRLLNKLHVAL